MSNILYPNVIELFICEIHFSFLERGGGGVNGQWIKNPLLDAPSIFFHFQSYATKIVNRINETPIWKLITLHKIKEHAQFNKTHFFSWKARSISVENVYKTLDISLFLSYLSFLFLSPLFSSYFFHISLVFLKFGFFS